MVRERRGGSEKEREKDRDIGCKTDVAAVVKRIKRKFNTTKTNDSKDDSNQKGNKEETSYSGYDGKAIKQEEME